MSAALDSFLDSLDGKAPKRGLSPALQALWWDAKGDWNRAHALAQEDAEGAEAALVHAYLHRREGDEGNAAYWYRRARRAPAKGPFKAEWRRIAEELLAK
jgi:hypothetical protein